MTMLSQLLLFPNKTRKVVQFIVVQYTFLIKSLLLFPHVQIVRDGGVRGGALRVARTRGRGQ